ncbi:MAG: universal stress protein [Loktanella sp.]|nr:universal stress protein [Loktanella sp.]
MFKTILVGTDGSDHALRALKVACDLAKLCDGEITLVHTPRPDTVAFAAGAMAGYQMITTMPDEEEVQAAARQIIEDAKKAAWSYGCEVRNSVILRGDPGDEIIAQAKKDGADLIVTGRRGLGNFAGLVLGSTSQRITHLADCAVLSVP